MSPARALVRLHDTTFVRYGWASAAALAADVGSFMAALRWGMDPAYAASVGYAVGIVAHWLISTRFVFRDGVADGGLPRYRQKVLFVISALAGMAVTVAIVGVGSASGWDPRVAKLIAIAVSFALTWLVRRNYVFR